MPSFFSLEQNLVYEAYTPKPMYKQIMLSMHYRSDRIKRDTNTVYLSLNHNAKHDLIPIYMRSRGRITPEIIMVQHNQYATLRIKNIIYFK